MVVVDCILLFLALMLALPTVVLLVQVCAALYPMTPSTGDTYQSKVSSTLLRRVIILMPAHNEATGIADVLRTLLPQLGSQISLLVIADNCSDTTIEVVQCTVGANAHVELIERMDGDLRGKGYALDFGVQHIALNPPDVVVVLDADCEIRPGSIEVLALTCIVTGRPVQALNLMRAPPGSSIKTRLAEFAWLVKNRVRALGYFKLGLPCQLMGTGMAFSWSQICCAKLNTGHIVEDMQLGLDLALAGTPPLFCPTALVTSYFPSSAEGLQAQRTRWEHGHLGVIVGGIPKLFLQSLRRRNWQLLSLVFDLCVPPLALLSLLSFSLTLVCVVWASIGGSGALLQLSALMLIMLGTVVVSAWIGFGRSVISFSQLCFVPMYVIAKVPMYFYFLVKRQATWVRSRRDGE